MPGGEAGDSVKPAKCKEMSDHAFQRSPFVKFMVDKLKEVSRGRRTACGAYVAFDHCSQRCMPLLAPPLPSATCGDIVQAGCYVDKDFAKVRHCDGNISGGFAPGTGVSPATRCLAHVCCAVNCLLSCKSEFKLVPTGHSVPQSYQHAR